MPHINKKAIAIGCIVDIGGSLVASLFYSIVLGIVLLAQGVPEAEMENRALADPSIHMASMSLGLAFVGAGGFVAARIARAAELTHSAIVGVVGNVAGLAFVLISDTTKLPSWYLPVSFALTLPIAILGGYFAKRRAAAASH